MPEKVVQEYKNSGWNITEKGAYRDLNSINLVGV